jgi:hypothetical protein
LAAPPLHGEVPKTCKKSIDTKDDKHSGTIADIQSGSTASGTGTETAQKLQSHMFTCIQVVELKLNITKI